MIKKRFLFEVFVGLIGIISALSFNTKGAVVLVLIAAWPFIARKMKLQEKKQYTDRELMLFYKTGNFTMGFFIVVLLIISRVAPYIGRDWLPLSVASLFLLHGWIGTIIFNREKAE